MEESFLVRLEVHIKHHQGHDELVVFEVNWKISCVSNKFHDLLLHCSFLRIENRLQSGRHRSDNQETGPVTPSIPNIETCNSCAQDLSAGPLAWFWW